MLIDKEGSVDKEFQIKISIETILHLMKLSFFTTDSVTKEILSFLVELSNNLLIFSNVKGDQFNIRESLILIKKIDETKFNNLEYLIEKNIQKLI